MKVKSFYYADPLGQFPYETIDTSEEKQESSETPTPNEELKVKSYYTDPYAYSLDPTANEFQGTLKQPGKSPTPDKSLKVKELNPYDSFAADPLGRRFPSDPLKKPDLSDALDAHEAYVNVTKYLGEFIYVKQYIQLDTDILTYNYIKAVLISYTFERKYIVCSISGTITLIPYYSYGDMWAESLDKFK